MVCRRYSEGLVVFAEHQTDGRGQRGNRWESTAGKGLWFSILLRPEIPLSDSGRLTIWAIEAISDVIRSEFGLEPAIKLPNDVQLNGRKVSGVLVEMRAQDKAPHLAVVGIGINVNQCRDDFPAELQDRAISLAMALGRRSTVRILPSLSCESSILRIGKSSSSVTLADGGDAALSTPAARTSLLRQPLAINARRNFGRLDLAAPTPEHVRVRNRDLRTRGDVDQSPPYDRGAVACPCHAPRP